ncbi:effector-associated constant component EACC1 [Microtetraspora malaysiensis]|uniref:effector-associated constant component EACC1 n=1 Tax=Microtetraspora malaysiensis TaxID=161358 RepID=UPI003D8F0D8C
MMAETVNLRMNGDFAEQELRSLYGWLMRDLDALDYMDMRLQSRAPGPGEMGDTLDLIALVVTSALQWPAFVETLSQWRGTRRHRPQVTIERGGTTVVVSQAESGLVVEILKAMKDHE